MGEARGATKRRWAIAALLAMPGSAYAAEGPSVSLAWRVPPECPSRDSFIETLESALQRKEPRSLRATIWVRHVEDRFVLHLKTPDSERERVFSGANCAEVLDAAALVLSLQPPQKEVSSDVDAVADADPVRTPSSPPPTIRLVASGGPAFDFGSSARPLSGINAMFGVDFANTRVELGAMAFLPVDTSEVGASTSTGVLSGRLRLSRKMYDGAFGFRPYALFDYSIFQRRPLGTTFSRHANANAQQAFIGVGGSLEWRYNENVSLFENIDVAATLIGPNATFPAFGLSTSLYAIVIRSQFGVSVRFF